jgi:hypothetical protein
MMGANSTLAPIDAARGLLVCDSSAIVMSVIGLSGQAGWLLGSH